MDTLAKRCTLCKAEKPISEFSRYISGGKERTVSRCKQCVAALAKERHFNKHPESVQAYRDKINDRDDLLRQGLKRCTRCKQVYPATDEYFYHHPKHYGGFHPYCKNCRKEWLDNRTPELIECARQSSRKNAETHRETARERARNWHWSNKERVSKQKRKRRERDNELRKARRRAHPEKHTVSGNNRRARIANLPNTLTEKQWLDALEYFGGCCAVCGKPQGLWHKIVPDHWIPIVSPNCPGTVATNIVPLCHACKSGEGGCNNSKQGMQPADWLELHFGKRKAKELLRRIQAYFDWITQ